MILTCPDCSTRYTVDANSLGESGRQVRCASCGHKWFAEPTLNLDETAQTSIAAEPEAAENDTGETGEEPPATEEKTSAANDEKPEVASKAAPHRAYREKLEGKAKRKRFIIGAIAWSAITAILVFVAIAAVLNRSAVVRALPNTASLFNAIGFPADRWGVELKSLRSEVKQEGNEVVMYISGELFNPGKKARPLPLVKLTLQDELGEEVYAWAVSTGIAKLEPQTGIPFQTSVRNYPLQTVNVSFDFIDAPAKAETPALEAEKPAEAPAEAHH